MKNAEELEAKDRSPREWSGAFCGMPEPSVHVVAGRKEWEQLWTAAFNSQPVPPVDFDRYFAIAVFLGSQPTGGYGVQFLEPLADAEKALIRYKVRKPGKGQFVIQAFTQPYAVKLYRRTGLKVSASEVP